MHPQQNSENIRLSYHIATILSYCTRVHLSHLGIQPYTHRMKSLRGLRLADEFPHYNKDLLIAYSEASPFYNPQKLWI